MRTVVTSKKLVWITLAAVLIVNILLVSVQTNKRFNTGFVRVWILDSVAPWEKLVDLTLNGVGRTWRGYFALVGLHGQNQEFPECLWTTWVVFTSQIQIVCPASDASFLSFGKTASPSTANN